MYGPIANLPGYNPNATYLPPGLAASSSYPERVKPTQQFYDMAPLPSVVDQSVMDLSKGSSLASDANQDSAFGGFGISGGIGGNAGGVDAMYGFKFPNNGSMDGLEYAFLNNFLAQQAKPKAQAKPEQMVPPNFSGPSNDQYSGDYLVQPTFGGPQQWNFGNFSQPQQTRVTAQEDGQGVITGQPGTWDYGQPSWPQDFYQSSFPLQPFDIQPSGLTQSQLDQLGRLPSLDQGIGAGWNTAANLAGLALPGFGGMALNALYGLGTGLAGETLTSDPSKGFLESMIDPREPGMIASGANWLGRQLSPAEESLQKAYSQTDAYDQSTGRYIPGAGSPGTAAAAAPTDFSGGTFGNGEWKPWYDGNPNPYSMTGNMLENASWGPGTKYVWGDPFNTD